MSLFTAAELADLKLETLQALPDLCTIRRVVNGPDGKPGVPDGRGSRIKTFADLTTNVPCRLDPRIARSKEAVSGGKPTSAGDWTISLPATQDIKAADQIVVTSLSNRLFEVIGVGSGSYEVVRLVEASEAI